MANYIATDTDLASVADAIRAKTGGSSQLSFPTGFNTEIATLTKTGDADATSSDILNGKTAYVNGSKVTGNIPSKAAATYDTSGSDQTISSGQYLSGNQTIRATKVYRDAGGGAVEITSDFTTGSFTLLVGDADNHGRVKRLEIHARTSGGGPVIDVSVIGN